MLWSQRTSLKGTRTDVDCLPPIVLVYGVFGFGRGVCEYFIFLIILSNGFEFIFHFVLFTLSNYLLLFFFFFWVICSGFLEIGMIVVFFLGREIFGMNFLIEFFFNFNFLCCCLLVFYFFLFKYFLI